MADHPAALTHTATAPAPTAYRVTVVACDDTRNPLVARFPVGWGP